MAFCRNCGNKLADDSVFCSVCGAKVAEESPKAENEAKAENTERQFSYGFSNVPVDEKPAKPSGVYGLGKAIAGAVCALVSFILVIVGAELWVLADDYGYGEYNFQAELATATVVFCVMAIAVGIVGIILSAKSIKNFKYAKNTWGTKPIATLVLGIAGLAYAILSVVLAFVFMLAASLYF